MADDDEQPRDFQVGYGRPPEHSRFQKGRSGNPRGRPAKRGTRVNIDALEAPVRIKVNGVRRLAHPLEATLRSLLNEAVKRKTQAIEHMLEIFFEHDAIEFGEVICDYGVILLPTNTVPARMADELLAVYGKPPWTLKQIATARPSYLSKRTEQEALEDEVIEYFDAETGALRIETAPTTKSGPTAEARKRIRRPKASASRRDIARWFAQETHKVTEDGRVRCATTIELLFHTLRAEAMAGKVRAHKLQERWLTRLKPQVVEGGYLLASEDMPIEKYVRLMEIKNRFAEPPPGLDAFYGSDDP